MTEDLKLELSPEYCNALVEHALRTLLEENKSTTEILDNPELEDCLSTFNFSPYYNKLLAIGLHKTLEEHINDQDTDVLP